MSREKIQDGQFLLHFSNIFLKNFQQFYLILEGDLELNRT